MDPVADSSTRATWVLPSSASADGVATAAFAWLLPMLPMMWAQWLASLMVPLLAHTLFSRRVYRSSGHHKQTMDVLDVLAKIPRALRFGVETLDQAEAPLLLVSTQCVAFCHVYLVGLHGTADVMVTVWRFRWAAPLVPPAKKTEPVGNTVRVLQRNSNRNGYAQELTRVVELVTPKSGMPQQVLDDAASAAAMMVNAFHASDRAACVFILHGAAGVGKSTAVRLLAHKLDAVMYADYNPTSASDNLRCMVSSYSDEDTVFVVAYEECDVSLGYIQRKEVATPEGYRLDACDKASWNALLDSIKRRTNVVIVMTTNSSKEELEELCDSHGSMLRRGRVDAHFIMVPGAPPIRVEPGKGTASCLPTRKLKMR